MNNYRVLNLLIHFISEKGVICLFDDSRQIIDKDEVSISRSESSKSMNIIDSFLQKNNTHYSELSNIVLVNGPGSFTGVRSVVLVANTIAYVHKIPLTTLSYFDLFDNYPIVKASSKRDLFVQKSKNDIIELVKNDDFIAYCHANGISEINGVKVGQLGDGFIWKEEVNYEEVVKGIVFQDKKIIEPLYIKKPSIS